MRTRSLLAWLGGFEARVAAAISEDGDNAIALGLLQSGQVLWNVMDQLHNGELQGTQDDEGGEGEEEDAKRCWKALLPFLCPTLPRAIAAQLASSSSSSSPSSSFLMPSSMLPAVLEAFLGAAVGPEVPERSQSIHQILALSVRTIMREGGQGGSEGREEWPVAGLELINFSFLSLLNSLSTRSSSRP